MIIKYNFEKSFITFKKKNLIEFGYVFYRIPFIILSCFISN